MRTEKQTNIYICKMRKENLLDALSSWENFEFVAREVTNHLELYPDLMEIALYNTEQRSWRAAYLIDKINDKFPNFILPYIEKMTEQLKTEKNSSKKRHFLKLIGLHEINEKHLGFLVEYCIGAMGNSNEPTAVRANAMQILYNISEYEPELKPEILAYIEHETENHSTAGIRSRGEKLAKKLRKQINKTKCVKHTLF